MFFSKLNSPSDDPLSKESINLNNNDTNSIGITTSVTKIKTESLTIRLSDELRIVNAMNDAAKCKTSGTIFSVRVDLSKATSLCIGVKDLPDKLLAVSMLKRINGVIGPVETAGMRLGDIIFGINFQPCRDGSKTLLQTVKNEMDKKRKTIHMQVCNCN